MSSRPGLAPSLTPYRSTQSWRVQAAFRNGLAVGVVVASLATAALFFLLFTHG